MSERFTERGLDKRYGMLYTDGGRGVAPHIQEARLIGTRNRFLEAAPQAGD
jgi:hypothetical protein